MDIIKSMKLISGSSNPELAKNIAAKMQIEHLEVDISHFANGEKRVWVTQPDQVRGQNIVLVQSFSNPTDEYIMEFLLIADALERMGARHVNAVIPWMGYSLQDKVFREGEPIAAKVVANLVSSAYIKRGFLFDLHNSSTPGFFSIPTQHLTAMSMFVEYVKSTFDVNECVVASPDFGGLKRARVFGEKLGVPLVNIDKHRDLHSGEVAATGLHGEVEGKVVLIFDDVINSGSTVIASADVLKQNGAKAVHFLATHGIFANQGEAKVQNSQIDSVVITNSIAHQGLPDKIKVLDCSQLFADAVGAWG